MSPNHSPHLGFQKSVISDLDEEAEMVIQANSELIVPEVKDDTNIEEISIGNNSNLEI